MWGRENARSVDWEKQGVMVMVMVGYGHVYGYGHGNGSGRWYKQNSIDRTEQSRADIRDSIVTASECMQMRDGTARCWKNKHILERSYHCCSISTRTRPEKITPS
jgi:hypothetical protein